MELLIGLVAAVLIALTAIVIPMTFRRVVQTNEVHIVQSRRTTTSYGREQPAGNTYYAWPAWVPHFGRVTTVLPMAIFQEFLENYQAYDKDRLPFVVDVIGFFQITDSNTAAQRNANFGELKSQIRGIVQGAIRAILAKSTLHEIMEGRGQFGEAFTLEVDHQLAGWGVKNVKTLELMDIRDAAGSKVIDNIMSVKKAEIEKTSRVAVANNNQEAQTAEINAKQTVDLRKQEAEQQVGTRTATAQQTVQIADQKAKQAVALEAAETATKEMAVKKINEVTAAEIAKQKRVIEAERDKDVQVFAAEGQKRQSELEAEGAKNAALFAAAGIQAKGEAEGAAATAIQMAPVNAQLKLAGEIGSNEKYQAYLVTIKQVEVAGEVGKANAAALAAARVQVYATSGTPTEGIDGVSSLFSPAGGLRLASMLEGFKSTPVGAAVAAAAGVNAEEPKAGKSNGAAAH